MEKICWELGQPNFQSDFQQTCSGLTSAVESRMYPMTDSFVDVVIICFASAAVAVDSSHVTASSSALWSRFSPP